MSASTLHRIEHGQRELTLSEIVALSNALQVVPTKLINLMTLGTGNSSTRTPSQPPHRGRPSTGC